ncbi:MAG: hypothetical protein ABI691_25450 [Ginsengibacter sp.]
MKKIYFFFLLIPAFGYAQTTDTTKVEQYCELVAQYRLLSRKVNIDVDYGDERKFFKDYRLKDETGKLKKFNSVVDALNYMGQQGWKLVNAFLVSEGSGTTISNAYHYVFRKEFLKEDVDRAEQ